MSLMPVLYTPKTRYTSDTNVLVPVIVNFLRAGAIMMLDWVTLRFIDHAPVLVWIVTFIISIAVLAVLQSKDWLDFKGRWYFTWSIGSLLAAWFITIGYAYWAYHDSSEKGALFPTADEIGEAIARHLPRPAGVPAGTPSVTPSVQIDRRKNPLNDDVAKWQAVSRLHDMAAVQKLPKCSISIVRYQLTYAEDFSDDLKAILKIADWPYKESFAASQVPRGMTIKSSDRQNESQRCGSALQGALRNSTLWKGGTWNLNMSYFPHDNTDCDDCVEINIGNDPDGP
jgi:predicted outer membrane lipoprotein